MLRSLEKRVLQLPCSFPFRIVGKCLHLSPKKKPGTHSETMREI